MFVIANKPGRFGNQLWVFANFIACAIEHGVSVANPSFDEYADWFRLTREDLFCRFPPRRSLLGRHKRVRELLFRAVYLFTRVLDRGKINLRWLRAICLNFGEELTLSSPELIDSARRGQIIFFQGWLFRDRANLVKHRDAIRAFFRPTEQFEVRIESFVGEVRRNCDVLVGVHIRHGDYKRYFGGKFFFATEDYAKLVVHVRNLFPDQRVAFLICSDEEQDRAMFSPAEIYQAPGHPLEDLYCLARCDYILGPPSSYSMWASFYGTVPLYIIENMNSMPALTDFDCIDGSCEVGAVWKNGRWGAPSRGRLASVGMETNTSGSLKPQADRGGLPVMVLTLPQMFVL